MKLFLKRWLIHTVAVLVATQVIRGISYDDAVALLLATLVLGILNTFIRPILILLSLPLLVLTLGLFMIVINAGLLFLTGRLFESFHVASFGDALLGAIVISLISMALNFLTGTGQTRVTVRTSRRPRDRDDDSGPGGGGPVIDV